MLKSRSGQKQMSIHPMPKFLQGIYYIPEAILGSFYFLPKLNLKKNQQNQSGEEWMSKQSFHYNEQ